MEFEDRLYSTFDKEHFIQGTLQAMKWDFVYQNQPLKKTWQKFYKIIESLLDLICLVKQFSFGRDKPPWMPNELIELIKDRDNAIKKAICNQITSRQKLARNVRNCTNTMVRNGKCSYIKDQLEINKKDSKKFWHSIEEVIPGNAQTSNKTSTHLNDYFATKGQTLAEKFTNLMDTPDLPQYNFPSMYLHPITIAQ